MCSLDRCTSSACATVEHDKNGFAGCVFYTVEVDNVDSDVGTATSFLVTNPGGETADVKLERHVGSNLELRRDGDDRRRRGGAVADRRSPDRGERRSAERMAFA